MAARVVLATRNAHKVAELRRILSETNVAIEVVDLAEFPNVPEVPETGLTFADNALLKAHAVAEATGLSAVADDSGLCLDVLAGMPGIFSARWAGKHGDDAANLNLLLNQLSDVSDEHRQAQFVCAAALVTPGEAADPSEFVVEGTLHGRLIREAKGDNGFGYDPIFVPDGYSVTTAQLSASEKDAISHRGQAFRKLAMEALSRLCQREG